MLFTEHECIVLKPGFVVPNDQILLRALRRNNMYMLDMSTAEPLSNINCFVSKASLDESSLWHRRLCHHKSSHHAKEINSITTVLHLLYMDLFSPTSVKSLGRKSYCLVITDDFSQYTWVFFLNTKDETAEILKSFILRVENESITRQFSAPRTPQQNGVAERRNRTLIEAVRTMLSDAKLPITFWAEAVNTACYVQNRVLVVKTHGMTPYEIWHKRKPFIGLLKPFGCQCTILNTKDHLAKFAEKSAKGYFVGYSAHAKAYRVYIKASRIIEESANVQFNEHTINKPGTGPDWLFKSDPTTVQTQNPQDLPEIQLDVVLPNLESINLDLTSQLDVIPRTRIHNTHPVENIIGNVEEGKQCMRSFFNLKGKAFGRFALYLRVSIPLEWVFRNKKDDKGVVIKNKARLVVQGYTQEEGIDYDEVFAPVARIEAIRIFLAFAAAKNFKVFQMDVKSAFLYRRIDEEVHVCQAPGFEDPKFPNHVCKLDKALYGLHQAPRKWYETLSSFLLSNHFKRGTIDKTLFFKKSNQHIMLVQIYVDDIIFGSTNESLCKDFESLMKSKFEMSSMGELTFFLGLQVKQTPTGIFISQSKYVKDILERFKLTDCKALGTPMSKTTSLSPDVEGEDVDQHQYRAMIGSLMYLTASRPDIMFATCLCARFQANPKVSHMLAVKRIFKYLKGASGLGLWYPRNEDFQFMAYTDSDYGGCNIKAEYIAASSCCAQVIWIQNQMKDYGVELFNTPIQIDNSSAISITNNPVKHSKTKHIDIRYHFIRDCAEKKLIHLVKVDTEHNLADLFTKAFDEGRFRYFLKHIVGLMNSFR
ncbi:hypothetical protein E3N88_43364 [Mikania micrantha]|uniref:Integrase catalytic domain-containing protein n=1 Tax=Mikania micrantha TaxID=192012 RepID=A0A5N6LFB0_9ASTR|nr:hypothetical protein E3N88_43364 [Mikania micrantha]